MTLANTKNDLVVDTASNDVEQFACDGLLTRLVVLQVEFTQEFVGVVGGRLHRHHSGGMLGGIAVEQSGVEHQVGELRDEMVEHGLHVGLDEEIVVERFHVLLLTGLLALAFTTLEVFLCLLGDNV